MSAQLLCLGTITTKQFHHTSKVYFQLIKSNMQSPTIDLTSMNDNVCAGRFQVSRFGSSPAASLPGGRYVFWNPAPGMTLLSGANPATLPGAGMYPSDNLGRPGARLASQPYNTQIGVAPSYPDWLPLKPALQVQFPGYSTAMSNVLTRRAAQSANEGVSARTYVYAPLGPQLAQNLSQALESQAILENSQLGGFSVPVGYGQM